MTKKRTVEIFIAGCPVCEDAINLVNRIACSSCAVSVLDMKDPKAATRAKGLGIRSIPAVVIDGTLAECCAGSGVDEGVLRAAGIGTPVS